MKINLELKINKEEFLKKLGIKENNFKPDTPMEIKQKLESLQGDKKLSANAIRDLPTAIISSGGGGKKKNIAKRVDLSSQCDGSNKEFSLPEAFSPNSVQLWSSQFPIVYRPLVDFTETSDGILLTSEVEAPASGQTLVALYEKS